MHISSNQRRATDGPHNLTFNIPENHSPSCRGCYFWDDGGVIACKAGGCASACCTTTYRKDKHIGLWEKI